MGGSTKQTDFLSIFLTVLIVLCFLGFSSILFLQNFLILPLSQDSPVKLMKKLQSFGINCREVAINIDLASRMTGISENLILAILVTESGGNKEAVSSKNYRGYMQIPYTLTDPQDNIIIGALILKEKLKLSNGDMIKAIYLYKGYPYYNAKGKKEVDKTLDIYYMLEREGRKS